MVTDPQIDERARRVLTAVIESYVETGEPTGSRTLVKKHGFSLSPATIRNIMADLEDLGLLKQPHTSAGRIPTEKGYRYYVDQCMDQGQPLRDRLVEDTQGRLESIRRDASTIVRDVTQELSRSSRQLSVAVAPRFLNNRLKRVELIPVRGGTIQAVVISEEGMVRNLLIDLDERYSQKNLGRISAYINRHLAGYTVSEARERVISKVLEHKAAYDNVMTDAMRVGRMIMERQTEDRLFVEGVSEALHKTKFATTQILPSLFRAIEEKHLIIQMFNMIEEMDSGVQVIIGAENPVGEMRDCAMVASPYLREGRVIGTIGVIGPVRMNYPRVMAMVDRTARFLTKVFSYEQGGSGGHGQPKGR